MKRNLRLYRYLTAVAVFTFAIVQVQAGSHALSDQESRRTVVKEFATDRNSQLEISNRYGKIDIKTWDKALVRITATVIVKASTKSKADERLNGIKTDISKTGSNIRAVTSIEEGSTSWWSGWWGSNNSASMEINYDVSMPAELAVILENKYGNIYLPDLAGKTTINLKYGNMYAGDLASDLLMDIAYGKATMGGTKSLSGALSYSDYISKKSGVVILTTKYSKVQIDELSGMTASSKYDTYKIGTADNVTVTGSYGDISLSGLKKGKFSVRYTNLNIGSLGQSLTADINYGSLQVDNLRAGFSDMTVSTGYAPVKIKGAVPCRVDISGKYFDADLGQDFIVKNKINESSSKQISGYKMSERATAQISINTRYGDVTIK